MIGAASPLSLAGIIHSGIVFSGFEVVDGFNYAHDLSGGTDVINDVMHTLIGHRRLVQSASAD